MFIGLMENYERVAELQKIAENSSGALFEASEKQAESLQGRINVLQNAWGNLHSTILTRDMAKDIVDFGTDAVNALTSVVKFLDDNFIPTMAGATAALIAFKTAKDGITFGQLIGQIGQATKKMMGFGETVKGVTAAGITLKSALLGLGVGVVVSLFTKMINDSKEAQAKMDALSDSVATLKSNLQTTNDNDVLITSYYKAKQALDSMVEGTEAQAKQQEKVNELRNALANANPSFKSIIDDENSSLDQQYQKMKLINDMEAKKIAQEALDNAPEQGKKGKGIDLAKGQYGQTVTTMDSALRSLDSWEAKLKELTEQQNSLISADASIEEINKVQEEIDNAYVQIDYQKEKLANSVEENSSLKQQLDSYNSILQANKAIGNDIKDRYEVETQLSEEEQAILDKATSIASEYLNIGKNVNTAKGEVDGLTDSVGDLAEETDKATSSMKKLNQDYVDELNKVEDIKELVEQINTDGLTLELATNALDSGFLDDFTGNITDAVAVQEHLNEKIRESGEIANQAYYNMMKNDEQYWQNKMANSQAWASHEQEVQNEMVKIAAEALGIQETDFSNFINEKGGFREVDYSNAKTMAQAEDLLQSNLITQISSYTSQLVNHKAGYRQTDMSNIVQFLNTQGAKEAKTVQELSDLWAKFYDAKRKAIEAEINDYYKETQKLMESTNAVVEEEAWLEDGALKHQMLNATKALNTLKKDNTTLTNYFAGIGAMFNGVSGGLSQTFAGGKGTSGGNFSSSPSSDKTSSSGSNSSSSDKDVDDLELEIDRYYELNDAIKDLENSLSSLQAKREQITTKDAYKKSMEEEIALINKQIKAQQNLLKEQEKERNEVKSTLSKNGFKFDGEGDISNYASQLKYLQNQANKKSGEAKEVAIAQVEALADLIEKYNELHNDSIPSTNVEIQNLKNEITNLNKELEENMKAIEKMGDRYFAITSQIAKVDNAISMNEALQEHASDERKIELMKEQIALIKQRQELTKTEKAEAQKEANELKQQLAKQGVTFNTDGQIANYKELIAKLESQANRLVGDAQDDAVEDIEELLDLINKYTELTNETIPELGVAWQDYANEMQSVQDAIEDIYRQQKETAVQTQKDIASAYEKYLTDRYNKLKEALNKEKEAYSKSYEAENFQRELAEEQRTLDEIAQQIAIYERDTSAVGQARLEQLRKEYEEQQKAINDMIRENEKSKTDEAFDKATEDLDKELEEALTPENVADIVNQALASGFITIGDSVIELNSLMTKWIDETGDGLYLLGDTIKSEMIDNLTKAKDLIKEMDGYSSWRSAINIASSRVGESGKQVPQSISFEFNQPLVNIEGNADSSVVSSISDTVQSQLKDMEKRIYNEMKKALT